MKTIEEEIWEYIDGSCDAAQTLTIEAKIASDAVYHQTYVELMQVHELISAEELDEPSMSFTRNVMEQVNLEIAPVALKTKVDNRIIYGIGAFFVLSILSIFIYAIANSTFTMPDFKMPKMNIDLAMSPAATSLSMKVFLFLDMVLALFYFDRYLRKTMTHK